MAHQVHVFISHSWNYSGHYETLADWIFDASWTTGQEPNKIPIHFVDMSIPKDNPIHNAPNALVLQQAIYNKIAGSHIIVIPTGMYATHSGWIQKEIDGANLHRKPILAVHPWAQERKSSVVAEAAAENVGWNKNSVVNEIWKLFRKQYGS